MIRSRFPAYGFEYVALLDGGFGGGWGRKFTGTSTVCSVRFVLPDSFLNRLTRDSRIVELDDGSEGLSRGSGIRGSKIFIEGGSEADVTGGDSTYG